MRNIFVSLLFAALISSASAASWTGDVETNTTSWTITRNGATIGLDLDSFVEGEISPIFGPGGRVLGSYYSYRSDIDVNDVKLRERTSAFEGLYSSEESKRLRSESENDVNLTITKPAGSNVWTIEWEENWPVTLNAIRSIDYAGNGINDRDLAGNYFDYAGTNFLYNTEFSKDRHVNLQLDRMNVTVVAMDDNLISVDLMPTKSIGYELESHSTGIADLKHKLTRDGRDVVSEVYERYEGVFDIERKINLHSDYNETESEEDWLSCCFDGYGGINLADMTSWNASSVFEINYNS